MILALLAVVAVTIGVLLGWALADRRHPRTAAQTYRAECEALRKASRRVLP